MLTSVQQPFSDIISTMDPNQLPPQQPMQNQYDYILNSQTPTKKPMAFGTGGGQKQRILVSVIFIVVVLIVVMIGFAVFQSATKKDYSGYKTALEQQTEIIRIADLGATKARTASVKNYASSVKSITSSEKADTASFLKSASVKVDEKVLAQKKDESNDKLLATAEQANQYDEKLISILNGLVVAYQKNIKSLPAATTKSEKALVTTLQNNAKVLANTPASQ